MSSWRYAVVLSVFASFVVRPSYADDSWSKLPIPPYATELKETVFPDNAARQFYYIVKRPYPFNGVKEFYIANLAKSWIVCTSNSAGWESFVDGTRRPEIYVHQQITYWADFGQQRLLLLALRYESAVPQPFCSGSPDNDRQKVYLAEYLEKDIKGAVELLNLKCMPK